MPSGMIDLDDRDDTISPINDIAKYATLTEANLSLNNANVGDLSVMYFNIESINSKFAEFELLLNHFDKKTDVILLSETKITEKCNMHYHPYLENYTFKKIKSKSYCGGVGVFFRN